MNKETIDKEKNLKETGSEIVEQRRKLRLL
jgi:hypothetical protein